MLAEIRIAMVVAKLAAEDTLNQPSLEICEIPLSPSKLWELAQAV